MLRVERSIHEVEGPRASRLSTNTPGSFATTLQHHENALLGSWPCRRVEVLRLRLIFALTARKRSILAQDDIAAMCTQHRLHHPLAQFFQRILRSPPLDSAVPQRKRHRPQQRVDEHGGANRMEQEG